ncbi:sulfotransferase family protein [Candidatus Pelagibacter sp.]|jgi:chondroitin 4-sulfotransferase 11|nr:sulfotransferase family protein [Candidatus Pelagibacter sp.]|tara:strand:+ start:1062 stop:1760 length:699 start_codon:yes stop_codon:yes gene_type:complete
MPISHSAKIIFVHIPKTGGGTIEKTLGIYGKDNNGNLSPDHFLLYGKYKNKFLQHLTISEIKKINIKEFDTYKKISFVRNPYDKIISEYLWRIQVYGKRKLEFKEYIIEEVVPRKNNINKFVKNFYKDESFVPFLDAHYVNQVDYLYINKKLAVNEIGKFENFESDFKRIFNKKLINTKVHKSKINYTYYFIKKILPKFLANKMHRKYYDQETEEIIRREYAKDLKIFNYNF